MMFRSKTKWSFSKKTSKSFGSKKKSFTIEEETQLCDELKFSASEAYKVLRTNLLFTLSGDKPCSVVGVTSSIPGEGKSVTSINLSYTLAQTGKRVLLIDADMRLPSAARRMKIEIL